MIQRTFLAGLLLIALAACNSEGGATTADTATIPPANSVGTGTATVSWVPPDVNTDGSALTDLAGYKIHYGTAPNMLDNVIDVASVGFTRYVIQDLAPATYYFAVTAYTASGVESGYSAIASKTIS